MSEKKFTLAQMLAVTFVVSMLYVLFTALQIKDEVEDVGERIRGMEQSIAVIEEAVWDRK